MYENLLACCRIRSGLTDEVGAHPCILGSVYLSIIPHAPETFDERRPHGGLS